ncbi:indolepyruvate ferredoxin oxidoreductase subunit alpha [Dethiosulfatarculus sandiegensis]|uniref:Indolepyruvate oxidoreductase subunit IorA n=1 Tax=Dethiosulfatarculus sandiegensis TaxID=1429043 RepID=A0A0D2JCN7_9BACT|nr:indolepyruvate ferredoxin oxidoreductase subunit alpha [Dethiosulfatarculus sandiegensis]KIX15909.1 indolepyruvate ferredoxin oxidoreductase [Dethiosulfatarculus sandiegensis]
MSELLTDNPGKKVILLGNEAIVRGAMEAGLAFSSCYPGTPSSEVPNNLFALKDKRGFYMEFATNEKVAMECTGGAAVSGLRSLTAMKHVGMNVASDPMMTLACTGVKGGMVIYNADDPSMFSSQNEQDNRYFAKFGNLPLLEPTTTQEMKDLTVYAFELSEELGMPVILRSTTRLAHARGVVELGEMGPVQNKGEFKKDPWNLVTLPATAPQMHRNVLARMEKARVISNSSALNQVIGEGDLGIVASGIGLNYALDAVGDLGLSGKVSVLKLAMTNPLPDEMIKDFLKNKKKVLIVEELEPYLEEAVKVLAQEEGLTLKIRGKGVGRMSRVMEYDPAMVRQAVADYFEVEDKTPVPVDLTDVPELPKRPPNLCPGCPHRMTYYAVKQAVGEDAIFPSDIGCYTLGFMPPYNITDFVICMGASASSPAGISKGTDKPIVAFIGDSTFFHSGMTGLANAVYNNHKYTLVILDNGITAMTGHQPSAAMDPDLAGLDLTHIELEDVVRGLGVKHVQVVKPTNMAKTRAAVEEAVNYDGLSVIISREPCPLHLRRFKKTKKPVFMVDQEKCKNHRDCIEKYACPAFFLEQGKVNIDPNLCIGCATCVQVCPEHAIRPKK